MASSSSSARPSVDRVRTCPLLLRVFVNVGRHHHPDEYRARSTPRGGLDVYTWRDATLRELAEEVKAAVEAARDSRARLDFALVYPNAQVRLRTAPHWLLPRAPYTSSRDAHTLVVHRPSPTP